METQTKEFDQLFEAGEIDLFLSKAKEQCEKKLRGRTFAGMEQEDVVQEVLIKVYKSLSSYDSAKAKLSTYIDRVIENMIKDSYKKCGSYKNLANINAMEIEDSYQDNGEEYGMGSSSNSISIGFNDMGYMRFEVFTDIKENDRLTKRERVILQLHYKGYEKVEIAEKLGVTKARISQIWKEMMEKMDY
ncbi:sigma-70 family RNA polymerase sigma factor [Solibacillus silvestris]